MQPPTVMSPVTQYVQVRPFMPLIYSHNQIFLEVQAHKTSGICTEFLILPMMLSSLIRSAQLHFKIMLVSLKGLFSDVIFVKYREILFENENCCEGGAEM